MAVQQGSCAAGSYDCPGVVTELRNDFTEYERGLLKDGWPMDLIEDPAKQARVVRTPTEFLEAVLVGDHLQEFVVFPEGVEAMKLGWEETVPEDLRDFLRDRKTGIEVARGLLGTPELLDTYKMRMDIYGGERMDMIRSGTKREKMDFLAQLPQVVARAENGTLNPEDTYFAEVSYRESMSHPISGMKTAAIFNRDVEHLLGPYASWNLHWDSKSSGLFVGSRYSGTGLHTDQTLWSDVGRNFQGYKLVAAWLPGETGARAMREFADDLFRPPLNKKRLEILRTAAKITLLRPGDMYLFSGGVAHSALCVSTDELCLGAYESIVTLNPQHVELWKHKGLPNRLCDGIHCIGDEVPLSLRYKFLNQSVDLLETVATQSATGGPTAQAPPKRVGEVPPEWDEIMKSLHSNARLQHRLRELYPQAVELMMRNKHFRRHVPQSVLEAAGLRNHSDPSLEDDYAASVQCDEQELKTRTMIRFSIQNQNEGQTNLKVRCQMLYQL